MSNQMPGPEDVRMRGFAARVVVQTALDWIAAHARPLGAEMVPLADLQGRVLAQDVAAELDVPVFTRSAMDGYALHGAETVGAGDYNPLPFRLCGAAFPGKPFEGVVPCGSAVRIMTGAPLPSGADAVLPVEYAQEASGVVEALAAVPPGKHVGERGEDVKAGATILPRGRRLRPQDVGLLASVGVAAAAVVRQPRVRILITGNELVPPGQPRGPFQIFDSNSPMLAGLVARDGGLASAPIYLQDDRAAIRDSILVPGADLILVSGGSSVGAEDHAPSIIAEVGELPIHGIAMRPSSPAGMGRVGTAFVFLLPGNPVSCLCAYDFFAGQAIRLLGGRNPKWPYVARQAVLSKKLVSAVGRVDYARVRLVDGQAEPLALSGASVLSSTTRADGFAIVPAECEGYGPGTEITVYLYDSLCF
jgi:molybdopterin molybdotransferase